MQVAAILKEKGREVVTADPDTPIAEIVATLKDKGIGGGDFARRIVEGNAKAIDPAPGDMPVDAADPRDIDGNRCRVREWVGDPQHRTAP